MLGWRASCVAAAWSHEYVGLLPAKHFLHIIQSCLGHSGLGLQARAAQSWRRRRGARTSRSSMSSMVRWVTGRQGERESGHGTCNVASHLSMRTSYPSQCTSHVPRIPWLHPGKSTVLPDDKTGFWASTTQLAYGECHGVDCGAGANGCPRIAHSPAQRRCAEALCALCDAVATGLRLRNPALTSGTLAPSPAPCLRGSRARTGCFRACCRLRAARQLPHAGAGLPVGGQQV